MSETETVTRLPLGMITRNPDAIRQVDKTTEEFQGLVSSVREHGVLQAIIVRKAPDGSGKYLLVDGDHRYTAAEEAGLDTIKVDITTATDEESYAQQYVLNFHRVETKPAEYGRHLNRILGRNPTMTAGELAAKLGLSISTINNRLKLTELHTDVATLVDSGIVNLSNALSLAGLPKDEQLNFLDQARTMGNAEFRPLVEERIKEIRKAKREGRDPNPAPTVFTPMPHLRKTGEIKAAYENPAIISTIVGSETDPVKAGQAVLNWAMNMDPDSVAAAIAADNDRKAKREAAKAKAAAEREEKKLADQERKLAEARAKQAAPATA